MGGASKSAMREADTGNNLAMHERRRGEQREVDGVRMRGQGGAGTPMEANATPTASWEIKCWPLTQASNWARKDHGTGTRMAATGPAR